MKNTNVHVSAESLNIVYVNARLLAARAPAVVSARIHPNSAARLFYALVCVDRQRDNDTYTWCLGGQGCATKVCWRKN